METRFGALGADDERGAPRSSRVVELGSRSGAAGWTRRPLRGAGLQILCRREGAPRRRLRPSPRRSARADGRERCRQEHSDEDPCRRAHELRRHDPGRGTCGVLQRRARRGRSRRRHHPPGTQPRSRAERRRQYLPWPRAADRRRIDRPAPAWSEPPSACWRALASPSRPTPGSPACASASSSSSRSPRRCRSMRASSSWTSRLRRYRRRNAIRCSRSCVSLRARASRSSTRRIASRRCWSLPIASPCCAMAGAL